MQGPSLSRMYREQFFNSDVFSDKEHCVILENGMMFSVPGATMWHCEQGSCTSKVVASMQA